MACIGTIIVGDMNIYQKRWIRLTLSSSVGGSMLQDICAKHKLRQMVDKPIHGQYVLDLTLTSTASAVRTSICGKRSDHESVLVHVTLPAIEDEQFQCEVRDYKRAKWSALIDFISRLDWSPIGSLPVHGRSGCFISSVLSIRLPGNSCQQR